MKGRLGRSLILLLATLLAREVLGADERFFPDWAPLGPLAEAQGFACRFDPATATVNLEGAEHAVVLAPGMPRVLVDGEGLVLSSGPRYMGGVLAVPPDLADLLRRLGEPGEEARVPKRYRLKRRPGARPTTAWTVVAGGLTAASGADRGRLPVVVLDPGHGGRFHHGGTETRRTDGETWTAGGKSPSPCLRASVVRIESEGRYAVLARSRVPAVIVELEFISNPAGERLLAGSRGKRKFAAAVAEGVLNSGALARRPGPQSGTGGAGRKLPSP